MTKKTELTIEEIVAEKIGDRQTLTMYALANVLSDVLGRRVREQQMYNYRAKKIIKNLVDGRITRDDAIAFVVKMYNKQNVVVTAE